MPEKIFRINNGMICFDKDIVKMDKDETFNMSHNFKQIGDDICITSPRQSYAGKFLHLLRSLPVFIAIFLISYFVQGDLIQSLVTTLVFLPIVSILAFIYFIPIIGWMLFIADVVVTIISIFVPMGNLCLIIAGFLGLSITWWIWVIYFGITTFALALSIFIVAMRSSKKGFANNVKAMVMGY